MTGSWIYDSHKILVSFFRREPSLLCLFFSRALTRSNAEVASRQYFYLAFVIVIEEEEEGEQDEIP